MFVSNSVNLYFSNNEYRKNTNNHILNSNHIHPIPNSFSQIQPSIKLGELKKYFDLHFECQFDELHYKCLYHYDQSNQIYFDEFLDYSVLFQQSENAAPQPNLSIFTKTICIDNNFHNFIDEMISSSNLLSIYRPERMRTTLYNYIANFQLRKSFQNNCYKSCYVRYSDTYGCAYEWNIESGGIIPLELGDKFFSEIHLLKELKSLNCWLSTAGIYSIPNWLKSRILLKITRIFSTNASKTQTKAEFR